MQYILLSILYTAAMLLVYLLCLKNTSSYRFSRAYLVASALLPLLMPLVRLPQGVQQRVQQAIPFQVNLPAVIVGVPQKVSNAPIAVNTLELCYAAISLLLLLWQGWRLLKLRTVANRNQHEEHDGYTLVKSCGYGPGSFGKYIFFPGSEVNESILAHELAHVKLRHTADVLLLSLLQCLFWPNVLLLWIRNELKQVHEFQADASVNADSDQYIHLLLHSVFNTSSSPVMNLFIIHPIKRRIMMLRKKEKSISLKTISLLSTTLAVLFGCCMVIQSCNKKTDSSGNKATEENITQAMRESLLNPPPELSAHPNPDKANVYTYVPKMPEPGYSYMEFLQKNLQYPTYAAEHNIQGKVIVRFVVDEQGNIRNVNCVRGVDPVLDSEAIRAVSMMPPWKPGEKDGKKVSVYFTMPIVFSNLTSK